MTRGLIIKNKSDTAGIDNTAGIDYIPGTDNTLSADNTLNTDNTLNADGSFDKGKPLKAEYSLKKCFRCGYFTINKETGVCENCGQRYELKNI
jgi:ribosomal protein L37E